MNWPNPQEAAGPLKSFLRKMCLAGRENVLQPGLGYRLNRSPGGTSLSIDRPGSRADNFRPFKVYKAAHVSDPSKSWRTFQVRSGLVGYRSNYIAPTVNAGNWQDFYSVLEGTDNNYSPDFDDSLDLNGAVLTPQTLGVSTELVLTGFCQFVLDPTLDDYVSLGAKVYLKISDGVNSGDRKIEVCARMFTNNVGDSTGRVGYGLPDNTDNYIMVAIIEPYNGMYFPQNAAGASYENLVVSQYLYNHALNRYPYGVLRYRGNYTVDTLTNQIFYPNDALCTGDIGAGQKVSAWVQTAATTTSLVDPSGSGNWKPLAYALT